jgi:two-component system, chemotaxis family, chemotaxis protein CheY
MYEQRILVAEDMAVMRDLIKAILRQEGFSNVVTVSDGANALKLLSRTGVELVIADWNMPEVSGVQLIKKLRTLDEHKDTPFILLTGTSDIGHVKQALASGVDEYIVKPFKPHDLIVRVKKLLDIK